MLVLAGRARAGDAPVPEGELSLAREGDWCALRGVALVGSRLVPATLGRRIEKVTADEVRLREVLAVGEERATIVHVLRRRRVPALVELVALAREIGAVTTATETRAVAGRSVACVRAVAPGGEVSLHRDVPAGGVVLVKRLSDELELELAGFGRSDGVEWGEAALAPGPCDPLPGNEAARAFVEEARAAPPRAASLLAQAVRADPRSFVAWSDLARATGDDGALDKALALEPDYAAARLARARRLLARDPAAARADVVRSLETKKPYRDPLFPPGCVRGQLLGTLGECELALGRPGVALAIAESALADPAVERTRDGALGAVRDRAVEALARVLRPPDERLVAIGLDVSAGKTKEALAAYDAFARAHPGLGPLDRWRLHEGIGLARARTGDREGALAAFDEALRAAAELPVRHLQESRFNRACLLAELGRAGEARAAVLELLWLEGVTRHDSASAGRKTFAEKVREEPALRALPSGGTGTR